MHPSQKMTRKERREALSGMWGDMPLNQFGIRDDGKFFAWQGKISALLSFNPQLQFEFRDAIKAGSSQDLSHSLSKYKPMHDRIRTILAQAIEELSVPEEHAATVLTADHGILWFINHCTWSARLKLAVTIFTAASVVFFAGFRLGAIDRVRNLYIQWENSLSAQPAASPTPGQPTK